MTAATLLREARRSANLRQDALAAISGVPQTSISKIERGHRDPTTETIDKLLACTGSQLIRVPTTRPTLGTIAHDIASELAHGREDRAYRGFLIANDSLSAEHGFVRLALAWNEPAATGDERYDAILAALAEHYLAEEDLPLPAWIDREGRSLAEQWFVDDSPYARQHDRDQTPAAFLRHGVVLAATELASV